MTQILCGNLDIYTYIGKIYGLLPCIPITLMLLPINNIEKLYQAFSLPDKLYIFKVCLIMDKFPFCIIHWQIILAVLHVFNCCSAHECCLLLVYGWMLLPLFLFKSLWLNIQILWFLSVSFTYHILQKVIFILIIYEWKCTSNLFLLFCSICCDCLIAICIALLLLFLLSLLLSTSAWVQR